jgi:hypothetical protein
MTEIDWLTGADPQAMLGFLHGNLSERKLRLFAVACCGRIRDLVADRPNRDALGVVERFADGRASPAELTAAAGWTTVPAVAYAAAARAGEAAESAAVAISALRGGMSGDLTHPKGAGDNYSAEAGERAAQCRLLRDILGNPFRPVTIDPKWLQWNNGTIPALALRIYEERTFGDLPILADALEDAGCCDPALLDHLRSGGEHVRGCWVVDLVLGKT